MVAKQKNFLQIKDLFLHFWMLASAQKNLAFARKIMVLPESLGLHAAPTEAACVAARSPPQHPGSKAAVGCRQRHKMQLYTIHSMSQPFPFPSFFPSLSPPSLSSPFPFSLTCGIGSEGGASARPHPPWIRHWSPECVLPVCMQV